MIMTFKDYLETISYFVTSLSLVAISFTYTFSKKTIHFATMQKCISDFRSIEFEKNAGNEMERARKYFELVNEELFYIENNYLPRVVAVEWIDGMLEYLPLRLTNNQYRLSQKFRNLTSNEIDSLLTDHPRIQKFINLNNKTLNRITLHLKTDLTKDKLTKQHHEALLPLIIDNLNISHLNKWFYRRCVKSILN